MELISRDALFINLDGMMAVSPTGYIHGDTIADMISDAPTIDAEPVRHGKWMPLPYDSGGYWKCSSCETPTEASGANLLYKYCPYCGARMDEE